MADNQNNLAANTQTPNTIDHPHLAILSEEINSHALDADAMTRNIISPTTAEVARLYEQAAHWAKDAYDLHVVHIEQLVNGYVAECRKLVSDGTEERVANILASFRSRKIDAEAGFRNLLSGALESKKDTKATSSATKVEKDKGLEEAEQRMEAESARAFGTKVYEAEDEPDNIQRRWITIFVFTLAALEYGFNLPAWSALSEGGWFDILATTGVVAFSVWFVKNAASSRALLNGFANIKSQYESNFGAEGYKNPDGTTTRLAPIDPSIRSSWRNWLGLLIAFTLGMIGYRTYAFTQTEDPSVTPLVGSALAAVAVFSMYFYLTKKGQKFTNERRKAYDMASAKVEQIKAELATPAPNANASVAPNPDPVEQAKIQFKADMMQEWSILKSALAKLGAAPAGYMDAKTLFMQGGARIRAEHAEMCRNIAIAVRDEHRVGVDVVPDPEESTLDALLATVIPDEQTELARLFDEALIAELQKLRLPSFDDVQIHTDRELNPDAEVIAMGEVVRKRAERKARLEAKLTK